MSDKFVWYRFEQRLRWPAGRISEMKFIHPDELT